MSVKRIAVLVSGGGTNLQALIDAQRRGEIVNGEIAAVIASKPGVYALERAKKSGIPGYVVARKDYPSNQAMTIALVDRLNELNIDLVVLAGFMVILTGEMVRAFPNAILIKRFHRSDKSRRSRKRVCCRCRRDSYACRTDTNTDGKYGKFCRRDRVCIAQKRKKRSRNDSGTGIYDE